MLLPSFPDVFLHSLGDAKGFAFFFSDLDASFFSFLLTDFDASFPTDLDAFFLSEAK